MLDDQHPFEVYSKQIKSKLRFEQSQTKHADLLEVNFVWGTSEKDNGNTWDPDNIGYLEFDDTFDPYSPESQLFLHDFCWRLSSGSLEDIMEFDQGEHECFMDVWQEMMQGECMVEHNEFMVSRRTELAI